MSRTISPTEPISTIATTAPAVRAVGEVLVAKPTDSIIVVGARMLDTGAEQVVLRDGERVVGTTTMRDVLRVMLTPWVGRICPAARTRGTKADRAA